MGRFYRRDRIVSSRRPVLLAIVGVGRRRRAVLRHRAAAGRAAADARSLAESQPASPRPTRRGAGTEERAAGQERAPSPDKGAAGSQRPSARVAAALDAKKTVVILFWNTSGVDDRSVKTRSTGCRAVTARWRSSPTRWTTSSRYTRITAARERQPDAAWWSSTAEGQAEVADRLLRLQTINQFVSNASPALSSARASAVGRPSRRRAPQVVRRSRLLDGVHPFRAASERPAGRGARAATAPSSAAPAVRLRRPGSGRRACRGTAARARHLRRRGLRRDDRRRQRLRGARRGRDRARRGTDRRARDRRRAGRPLARQAPCGGPRRRRAAPGARALGAGADRPRRAPRRAACWSASAAASTAPSRRCSCAARRPRRGRRHAEAVGRPGGRRGAQLLLARRRCSAPARSPTRWACRT